MIFLQAPLELREVVLTDLKRIAFNRRLLIHEFEEEMAKVMAEWEGHKGVSSRQLASDLKFE
jgi:hypothetical protein